MEDETVLERRLNGDEEPNHLPLKLLQQITNDFSNERIIGKGGFGAVYKGVLRNGIIVAVKRIDVNIYTVDDKSFRREFNSFYNTNHENVVRFLGFCSNTYKTSIKEAESGNYNLVNINERLLCLEYIRNGSLNEHIADELRGLEWETRYEIIAGICRGLDYLHNIRKIIHMDLKPANILLDGNDMIPKITDFGLSRPNEDSHTTALCFGTPGYLAPEYREGSKGTTACDIYSLGAIIIELVTGCIGVPDQHNVLRRWRHRWSNPVTPLQYQQVIKCVEIAGHCRAREPEDRPSIEKIIKFLSENTDEQTGQESTYLDDDMLGIEPLELHFTFELNKEVSWPVNLTNGTRACFAFKIENPSKKYTIGQDKGIVASGCKCLVEIIVGAPEVTQNGDNFIVWSTKVSKDLTVDHITEHTFHQDDSKVVDKVYLKVLCEPTKPLRSREDTRIRIPVEEVLEKREIAQSASGKGKNKVGSSENATNKMQSQLPRTPIQAGEDIVSGKQSSTVRRHPSPLTASRTCGSRQPRYPLACLPVQTRTDDISASQRMNALLSTAIWEVGKALAPVADSVMGDWDSSKKVGLNVEPLRSELLHVKATLETSRHKHIASDAMEKLLGSLRDSARSAEDLLDELDYFRIHNNLTADHDHNKHPRQASWFIWPFSRQRSHHSSPLVSLPSIGFNMADISERMKHIVDQLKHVRLVFANILQSCDRITIPDIAQSHRVTTDRSIEPKLYGRDIIMNSIIDDMTKDKYHNNDLNVLPIVGPGGIGKTTMIQHICKNEEVKKHFHVVIWVCVSLKFNLNKVLEEMTIYIPPVQGEKDGRAEDLIEQRLKSKRFLLILDDIWEFSDGDDWKRLLLPLKTSQEKGSMIIVTTRFPAIAEMVGTTDYSIELEGLESKYFRELFHSFVFGDEPIRNDLLETGDKIMEKLKGSPLAAKTVGILLRNNLNLHHWRRVLESKQWEIQIGANDIMPALKLSYDYLPFHQQQCFSYSALFPEDYKYSTTELINLWIGLDILQLDDQNKTLEDMGLSNLNVLVTHGFFREEETKKGLHYVMHDLLHDLALKVASHECITVHHSNVRSLEIQPSVRHLSIIIDDNDKMSHENFKSVLRKLKTRLKVKQLHTLMLFGKMDESFASILGDLFGEANALRVLHVVNMQCSVESMLPNFSTLVHLRYLCLGTRRYKERLWPLASSRFYHLRVLDLGSWYYHWDLPKDLSNLAKLRRLYTPRVEMHSDVLNVGKLVLLEELKVFRVNKESEGFELKQLEHLTELRELGIYNLENIHTNEEAVKAKLIEKNFLERLTLDWDNKRSNTEPGVEQEVLESLQPHQYLQELCIRGHGGPSCPTWLGDKLAVEALESLHLDGVSWQCLPSLGKMQALGKVILKRIAAVKEFVIEQSFCRLIRLELVRLGSFKKWVPSHDAHMFPLLQVLIIRDCPKLLELPLSNLYSKPDQGWNIDWFPKLQELEIKSCRELLLVAHIPWTETLCHVNIWDVKLVEKFEYDSKSSDLNIMGKGDLQSLTQLLPFSNLTGLERLTLRNCPPLEWKHFVMLNSLKIFHVDRLDSLVGPFGGEGDVELHYPVEQLVVQDVKAPSNAIGKVFTELLSHLPRLSELTIWECENIRQLAVGVDVTSAAASEVEKEDGLLLFPVHLSDSLRVLVIYRNPELVLVDPSTFLQALRSLQELRITASPKFLSAINSFSYCLFPSSLQVPHLDGVEGMGTLEPLSILTSLTRFELRIWGENLRCKGIGPLLTNGGLHRASTVVLSPRFFAGWNPNQRRELLEEQLVFPSKVQVLRTNDFVGLLTVPICSLLSSSLTKLQLFDAFNYEIECFAEEQEDALHLLVSLQELQFHSFSELQHLPAGLHKLPNLKRLQVKSCPSVRSLPKDGLPKSLQELDVRDCDNEELIQQYRGLVGTIPEIKL